MGNSITHRPDLQATGSLSDQQAPAPHLEGRAQRRQQDLKLWLWLLLILCLGGLSSLSLAEHLSLEKVTAPHPQAKASISRKATPNITHSVTSTPTEVTFIDGQCETTPQQITYRQSASATLAPPTLPADWFEAGRKQADFALAQSCAASFVMAYLSFDASKPATFESFAYMLSAGAKQRFYGLVPSIKADIRVDPTWRASIQEEHIVQAAQVSPPTLVDARYTRQKLLVWMTVPFVTSTMQNKHSVVQQGEYTVLLVAVPADSSKPGTGWQISAWQHGTSFFPPYEPL